jgi:hypothetical protein
VKAIWDSEKSTMAEAAEESGVPAARGDDPRPDNESTVVSRRPRIVHYSIALRKGGERQAVLPATKQEIAIGRGSAKVKVDLPITGDAEVSRLHAILLRDPEGLIWLTAQGRNPVYLNGKELRNHERVQVTPHDQIGICSFSLQILSIKGTNM